MSSCPCNSGAEFEECCRPFLDGVARPSTATALMRSRYTAYTKRRIDYLRDTHDPKTRKHFDADRSREWAETSRWKGLDVVSAEGGGPEDTEGTVEFIARYETGGDDVEHHEIGKFRRLEGRWYFVDGKVIGQEPIRREGPKIGRNDPCPCGSGKKYKKCCGRG